MDVQGVLVDRILLLSGRVADGEFAERLAPGRAAPDDNVPQFLTSASERPERGARAMGQRRLLGRINDHLRTDSLAAASIYHDHTGRRRSIRGKQDIHRIAAGEELHARGQERFVQGALDLHGRCCPVLAIDRPGQRGLGCLSLLEPQPLGSAQVIAEIRTILDQQDARPIVRSRAGGLHPCERSAGNQDIDIVSHGQHGGLFYHDLILHRATCNGDAQQQEEDYLPRAWRHDHSSWLPPHPLSVPCGRSSEQSFPVPSLGSLPVPVFAAPFTSPPSRAWPRQRPCRSAP